MCLSIKLDHENYNIIMLVTITTKLTTNDCLTIFYIELSIISFLMIKRWCRQHKKKQNP